MRIMSTVMRDIVAGDGRLGCGFGKEEGVGGADILLFVLSPIGVPS